VVLYPIIKRDFPGRALPDNAMTEQQKLTFPMLMQQLDGLMLRDKQRFARRLHGVKKVKNPDAQQAIYRRWRKD
jgi:ATP-dependent helicase HrpA